VATVAIPATFIRFISFKCPSWDQAQAVAYAPDSKQYAMQKNTYTKATKSKPMVFALPGAFHGYPAVDAELSVLKYAEKVVFYTVTNDVYTPTSGELVPYLLGDAFCFNVAATVYAILNQPELHNVMIGKRDALL
jgi:hypothetical protein